MSIARVVVFVAVFAVALGSEIEDDAVEPPEDDVEPPEDDVEPPENGIADGSSCASEFLEWCRNRSEGSGRGHQVSVISNSYLHNDQSCRIDCISNSSGVNCMENGSPWFHCFPNGKIQYEGKELKPDYENDEGICSTKERAKKMFGAYTVRFNHAAFEKSMKAHREKMRQLEQRMEDMSKKLKSEMSKLFGSDEEF